MSDHVLMIPYLNPAAEVLQAYPTKLILYDDRIEIFSRYEIIEQNEESGLKEDVCVDLVESISKNSIDSIVYGRSLKHDPHYLLKIHFSDRSDAYFIENKKAAKSIYETLIHWRYADS